MLAPYETKKEWYRRAIFATKILYLIQVTFTVTFRFCLHLAKNSLQLAMLQMLWYDFRFQLSHSSWDKAVRSVLMEVEVKASLRTISRRKFYYTSWRRRIVDQDECTTVPSCSHLDNTNVLFGKVIKGMGAIQELNKVSSVNNKPLQVISH